jgi:GTPase SAR1 family protein
VGNLDPAADAVDYRAAFDIRDLVSLDEVMTELDYGPNGGLLYCMEYLLQNSDWLQDILDGYADEDYIVLDCPGQVELYSHLPIMRNLARQMTLWGYRVVCVYLIDALYVLDPPKFISGCLLSLSCMMQMEQPHINVITKCDMADKEQIKRILDHEGTGMLGLTEVTKTNEKYRKLTSALSSVVDDYMMVSFVMLDRSEEDTIAEVMAYTDRCIQYDEEIEPKDPYEKEAEETAESMEAFGAMDQRF